MTLKTFYLHSNGHKSITFVETINVESARNKMNDSDFDTFLSNKYDEILERHGHRWGLVVKLCDKDRVISEMTKIDIQIMKRANNLQTI